MTFMDMYKKYFFPLFVLFTFAFFVVFVNLSSAQTTKGNCRDNPYPPPTTDAKNNFKYVWKADCVTEVSKQCKINDDCPKNSNDLSRVNPQTSNWCYEFEEGNRCMQLISKRKVIAKAIQRRDKTQNYLKKLDKFNDDKDPLLQKYLTQTKELLNKNLEEANKCAKKIENSDNDTQDCKDQVKQSYNKTKAAYRLVKYQAVVSGVKDVCVEADLGQQPRLEAKGITTIKEKDKNNPKETGKSKTSRLYLCNGEDGKIKWRIISSNNKLLRIIPEDEKRLNLNLDKNNLPNKEQLTKLKELLQIKD